MKRWFALAIVIVIADQATKWLAETILCCRPPLALAPFFNLVLAHNTGAAFSFLSDASGWQRWFFTAIAAVAVVVISVLIRRHPGQPLLCTGLALILGGAAGNLVDRVLYGHVVDFLDFHAIGWHWPAFNLADSAITAGAVLLILDGFRKPRDQM